MNFIAILITLAVERWTAFSKKLRTYPLLQKYIDWMSILCQKMHLPSWLSLLCFLLPAVIIIGIVNVIAYALFLGLPSLAFSVFVLFYCLGAFPSMEHSEGMDNIVVQANRNVFSVLFWFMLCGPVGAVFYRLNSLLVSYTENPNVAAMAERLQTVLEWIPVRLEVLAYALISNFRVVLPCFMKYLLHGLDDNEQFLIEAASAAVSSDAESVSHDTLKLVDNALLVWLIVIAIIVLL